MREKNPSRFSSRIKNKLLYLECGTSETLLKTCKNLNLELDILVSENSLVCSTMEKASIFLQALFALFCFEKYYSATAKVWI